MKRTFYIESLGCSKNSVDSESIKVLLLKAGLHPARSAVGADIILVNTCGFIDAARQESIEILKDYGNKKRNHQVLIASGCMAQHNPDILQQQVPQIDGLLSTRRWMDIENIINRIDASSTKLPILHGQNETKIGLERNDIPRSAIQGASAYIKIADGCRRPCAFCAIPIIKGTVVSREISAIVDEAMMLEKQGVKEIILIAQDTTDYGKDLGYQHGLEKLLEMLISRVPGIPWFRLMYTYPGNISDRLIGLFSTSKQIIPYLDLPLQHAHPDALKRMRRPSNMDWTRDTIHRLRRNIADLAIRTTFIVGFPGENEDEFQTILEFIEEIEFDHVGAFIYSHEEKTSIYSMGDTVPEDVKHERYNQLMLTQQEISARKNRKFVGKKLDVLIEGVDNGISIGRSYRDAPEIDGMVIVNDRCPVGEIIEVEITDSLVHDLIGTRVL